MTDRHTHSHDESSRYAVAASIIAILWIIAITVAFWIKAGGM